MKILFSFLPVLLLLSSQVALGQSLKNYYDDYLFVNFTGNSIEDEQIHYALSKDGYSFTALNDDRPIINSKLISSTGGVRDPHDIYRNIAISIVKMLYRGFLSPI